MADVKISELSLAAAAGDSVVPASNAAGSETNKVTLLSVANLATPANIGAAAATHSHAISDVTGLQADLDAKATQSDIDTAVASLVDSDPTGITGADAISNAVSLTQAEYDAITPDASTLYVITE